MNLHTVNKLILVCVSILFVGCETAKPVRYEAFETLNPTSILILPPNNQTNNVEAHNYLAATLPKALYARGYYVFPYNTVKTIFEHEGFSDPGMIHTLPPSKLASLFGAQAILYSTVTDWSIDYAVFNTYLKVSVEYNILAPDGTELWAVTRELSEPMVQNQQNGLLNAFIATAITQAVADDTDILPAASRLNVSIFNQGVNPIPLRQAK
jgi:hypothetical protein